MHLPGPIRAAVGLAASAADEARHLPDRALELPMVVVGTALQLSLRAQQRYAMLAARGDAVLSGRATGDEPPPWATFDDDPMPSGAGSASGLVDSLFGTDDPAGGASVLDGDSDSDDDAPTSTVTPIAKASGRTAAERGATKRTPAKKSAGRKTATKKSSVKAAPPAGSDAGKTVSKPRHTAPSKFDDATDD